MIGRSTTGGPATFSTMKPSGTWRIGSSSASESVPKRATTARRASGRFIMASDSTTPGERGLSLQRFAKKTVNHLVPDLVARVVHVKAVLPQQLGPCLAFGVLHLAPRVDVAEPLVRLREGLDEAIDLLAFFVLRGALDIGEEGDEVDLRLRERRVDFLHEVLRGIGDLLGRFPSVDVVAAGGDDDDFRLVRSPDGG